MADRELAHASVRVQEILAAAEQAAEEMRLQAERRMESRIAEGGRAAANRMQAAEAEALEILAGAQEQADKLLQQAKEAGRRDPRHRPAGRPRHRRRGQRAAREVLRDGTEMSGHLRELSDSLRTNAELLLRDVRLAHAEMTARLDQVSVPPPSSSADPASSRTSAIDALDVPEFHPGRR
jgi:hypothetical protein